MPEVEAQHEYRDVDGLKQSGQVGAEGLEFGVTLAEPVIKGGELLIGGLELFFRGHQLLVRALELLINGEDLFVGHLELRVHVILLVDR